MLQFCLYKSAECLPVGSSAGIFLFRKNKIGTKASFDTIRNQKVIFVCLASIPQQPILVVSVQPKDWKLKN
jgi:hypothetical protein